MRGSRHVIWIFLYLLGPPARYIFTPETSALKRSIYRLVIYVHFKLSCCNRLLTQRLETKQWPANWKKKISFGIAFGSAVIQSITSISDMNYGGQHLTTSRRWKFFDHPRPPLSRKYSIIGSSQQFTQNPIVLVFRRLTPPLSRSGVMNCRTDSSIELRLIDTFPFDVYREFRSNQDFYQDAEHVERTHDAFVSRSKCDASEHIEGRALTTHKGNGTY